jgi:hypothetical protein
VLSGDVSWVGVLLFEAGIEDVLEENGKGDGTAS